MHEAFSGCSAARTPPLLRHSLALLMGVKTPWLALQGVASHNAAAGKQCSPRDKGQRQRRQAAKETRLHRTPGYPTPAVVQQQTYLGAPHADLPHGPMFPSLPAPDPMRGRG